MKTHKIFPVFLFLALIAFISNAQLTPQQAIAKMTRGINIGNTMEPTPGGEGTWGNPILQEYAFDDYKNAGFTTIRIPITWDNHTSTISGFSVSGLWMDRVEQVVDWGLSRGLIIIMNAHHEDFIKKSYTTSTKARFDSIWSQISVRMKDKSDKLIFEILNEPNPLAKTYVDDLNTRILKIIRKTNPTRIVSFSGNSYSNSAELLAAKIPSTTDQYLIGYYHSYDPYPFGLVGADDSGKPLTYGTASDISVTQQKFDDVTGWAATTKIPVILDEFGAQKKCDYNSRMLYYATVVDQAIRHNVPFFAWDDGGDFPIYQRTHNGWNEIKDILIYTYKESPNQFTYAFTTKSLVKLSWQNRTVANDSIIVERSTSTGVNLAPFAKLAPGATQFVDTTVKAGKSYYYRLTTTVLDTIVKSYPLFTGAVTKGTVVASINEPAEKSIFKLYPNPASGQVIFQGPVAGGNAKMQVYNLSGKLLKTYLLKHETSVIPLDELASGTYLFTISNGNIVEQKKVVIE